MCPHTSVTWSNQCVKYEIHISYCSYLRLLTLNRVSTGSRKIGVLDHGLLPMYCYFTLHFLFCTICIMQVMKTMCVSYKVALDSFEPFVHVFQLFDRILKFFRVYHFPAKWTQPNPASPYFKFNASWISFVGTNFFTKIRYLDNDKERRIYFLGKLNVFYGSQKWPRKWGGSLRRIRLGLKYGNREIELSES